ncbi:rhodanese-related sulfurtransferase [Georgenia soli]|uniref:Rhodanese-related sulfurtransferase n=1 Tax=Georgenia soli TaxID=638953 RepID=A0A2A9F2M7_9MICO|nr:rhodanese-like domain-containing protein [Georgenia soli]PFG45066.1 rhodanese-related sulfurtransferase [Georgenia soli]
MTALNTDRTTDQTVLDPDALAERLSSAAPPRLIDVRTPAEFETVHIPGAYNVPLDTLKEHREEIARHLDEDVVLVCRSGQRATQAKEALATAGLPNLHLLDGGMQAWQASGGEIRRGKQKWDLERQVRLVAGTVVLGSILASVRAPGAKWLAAGLGGGLTFASLTNTCAMGAALSKLPYNRGTSLDPADAIAQLRPDTTTA